MSVLLPVLACESGPKQRMHMCGLSQQKASGSGPNVWVLQVGVKWSCVGLAGTGSGSRGLGRAAHARADVVQSTVPWMHGTVDARGMLILPRSAP